MRSILKYPISRTLIILSAGWLNDSTWNYAAKISIMDMKTSLVLSSVNRINGRENIGNILLPPGEKKIKF